MRAMVLLVLAACGGRSPAESPHARTASTVVVQVPIAAVTGSAVAQPAQQPPVLVVLKSRDQVPDALRDRVPPHFDFGKEVLVGYLRPGNAVRIIEKPALVEERAGALRVVGIVHHIAPPARDCPGGMAPDPTREPPPRSAVGEMRIGDLVPSFLVVLDRARVLRARSLVVLYGVDVDDPPPVYRDPNLPCPAYP